MKIVVYSPTFPPVIDGTSKQAKRLVDVLSKKHDVYGLTFSVDSDIRPQIQPEIPNVQRFIPSHLKEGKFPPLNPEALIGRIEELKPDVVHLRGWYQLLAVKAIIGKAKELGAKIFWHADGIVECHEKLKDGEEYKDVLNFAENCGTNFVIQTSQGSHILSELGIDRKKTFRLPPILPSYNKDGKDFSSPIVLYVGRFYSYKGHRELFETLRRIAPQLEIVLAGHVDTEEGISIADSLIKEGATLVLNPTDHVVSRLYEFGTHHFSMSRKETLGISTLEAVAAGCIPLARNTGGIYDYLDNDFLFADDEEFNTKALRLLREPQKMLSKLQKAQEEIRVENIEAVLEKMHEAPA